MTAPGTAVSPRIFLKPCGDRGDRRLEEDPVPEFEPRIQRRVGQEFHGIADFRRWPEVGGHGPLDPRRQRGPRIRHRIGTEQLPDPGLPQHELVLVLLVEAERAEGLMGYEEGIGEHVVHPGREPGVIGV